MACGLPAKRIFIYKASGKFKSPGYSALPITLSRASILLKDLPIALMSYPSINNDSIILFPTTDGAPTA
jgi:hypothetical protein